MDSAQLEEYRKRMQERYQSRAAQPAVPPQALQPIPPHQQPSSAEDDERLARELQAQEDAQRNEELARRLQAQDRSPSPDDVPPPRNIQREERLVDPNPPPMGYFYPQESVRPLLSGVPHGQPVMRAPQNAHDSCLPESDKCCGTSSQRIVLTLSGLLAVAIIVVLITLAATSN